MYQRLILKHLPKPSKKDITSETYWVCNSLGLSSGRDTTNLSTQVILKILEERSGQSGISSEEIALLLGTSVGRTNHHIRTLAQNGIIYRDRKLIHLRGATLKETIKELRKDAERIFDELESVAEDIDTLASHGSSSTCVAVVLRDRS